MRSVIKVVICGVEYETKAITFPSGEIHASLPDETRDEVWDCYAERIEVLATIRDAAGVLATAQVAAAIKNLSPSSTVIIVMPYFPHSRQDRICNPGEAIDRDIILKLFEDYEIVTLDMHSYCEEVTDIPQWTVLEDLLNKYQAWVSEADPDKAGSLTILGPDKGSRYKLTEWLINTKYPQYEVGFCNKVRDPATGELSGFKVPDDLDGKEILMVDDICDGGGTALGLVNEIRKQNPASVTLLVTHGIFSKGVMPLLKAFDGVVCTDSIVDVGKIGCELRFDPEGGHYAPNMKIIPVMEVLYEQT